MKSFLYRTFLALTFWTNVGFLSAQDAVAVRTPLGEIEASIPASSVEPGALLLDWVADSDATLSGFYLRLTNCLPPRDEPIVVSLQVRGETLEQTVAIPKFTFPLAYHTRPYDADPQTFPPVDVGREFRRAVEPIKLLKGDSVRLIVSSCGSSVQSGLTGGLQFQGRRELVKSRFPFRQSRTNGPVCDIPWTESEVVAVGTHVKFDPRCAPQNNSSVIADADGTLYIFCAYYSVDEQYGGGRDGSYSRIFGYKKSPGAAGWEDIGCVVDLMEGTTYSGDPFVFRDLQGRPTLLFTTCDGTRGFVDWQKIGVFLIHSETDSFAGPWSKPVALWDGYPREPDDNKTGGRANCLRIYPRQKTNDYLITWNHGAQDMDVRGLVVSDLETQISHEAIGNAPILVKNQEEGGGGFTCGDKGYYSTWQIPWLNDPNGIQRVYEIDLNDPLNPESWRVLPGSLGFNDGADPKRDGGTTADAWAVSIADGRLWATSCEYSVTEKRNYLYVRSAPIPKGFERAEDAKFQYGAVRIDAYKETFPTVEYALGQKCSLDMNFKSFGDLSYMFVALGPSDAPGQFRTVFFEVNPHGTFLVAYKNDGTRVVLAESKDATWKPEKEYRVKLVRDGAKLTGYVDEKEVISATISDREILDNLDDEPRFRLYGWQGGRYEVSDLILIDGE